jgi:hypothetical protein
MVRILPILGAVMTFTFGPAADTSRPPQEVPFVEIGKPHVYCVRLELNVVKGAPLSALESMRQDFIDFEDYAAVKCARHGP